MLSSQPMNKLLSVITEFRQLDTDIQTDTMLVFCLVALNPGITSRDIQINTGMSQSAVSRHLAKLSELFSKETPGLNLVENIEDPADRRTKRSYLKHRGRVLAIKIAGLLDPAVELGPADFPLAKDLDRRRRRS